MKIWDQFKSKSLTKQIFLMVSVVFGGYSSEYEVSVKSGKFI